MHCNKVFISGFICFINLFISWGQSFTFHHLETVDGLSQVTVHDVWQDEFGRMWFATRDGLNCYDGASMKVFRPIPGDTTSLPSSRVYTVTGDHSGQLFLRAQSSFVVFDMRTERFRTVLNTNVGNISKGEKGVWVCSGKDLFLYDIQTHQMQKIYTFGDRVTVYSIDEDSKGTCWISTSNGLFSLDKNYTVGKHFPDHITRKVIEDRLGNLWVLSSIEGVS